MSLHDTASGTSPSYAAEPLCGYPVSPRKFWIMTILTARLYAVYWAYKNFLALDPTPAKRPQILAGINSVLIVFRFNHLMKLIEAEGVKYDVPVKFPRIFYMVCLLFIIPVIGGALAYFAVPFGFVAPVVLTTWLFSQPNDALLKINTRLAPQARINSELTPWNSLLIALVFAFIYLHPLDKLKLSPSHWLDQLAAQHCRWIYDDPNNRAEQEEKARKIKAMDRFWDYYKSQGDVLFDSEKNAAPSMKLFSKLSVVHPQLRWKGKKTLDAQGKPHYETTIHTTNPELFPMIRFMIGRAPKFANCNYYWCEQPVPPNAVQQAMENTEHFKLTAFDAKCHLTKANSIAVEITSPDFDDKNENENMRIAYAITYMVLGQEAFSTWLGKITAKCGPSQTTPPSAAHELKSDFELLKVVALNKLPDKYYYETRGHWDKYFTTDNSTEAMDLNTLPKPDFVPNVLLAVTKHPFDSRRFSKKGEKIIDFTSRTQLEDEATVEKIFNEADVALAEQKAGSVFMGYRQTGELVFLCAVNDLAKAKQVFKDLCEKHKLSHQSWILFLDADMYSEQIGIFPETQKYIWNEEKNDSEK